MATYTYRATIVTTKDYGDGPGGGRESFATLAILPDGSRWQDRPQTISLGVPVGTRPGQLYRVSIDPIAETSDGE